MRARTGTAQLPLHGGKAPAWLFSRMIKLAREISIHIVSEFGPDEMLRRLSDPFWFQAFGCVLGFDWHSSGVTTTVTGALKEGIRGLESDLGFYAGGGKGAASRKTPAEIAAACDRLSIDARPLVYASRMSAKAGRLLLHADRRLVRRAAGNERCEWHGAQVPLVVDVGSHLRQRTTRRGVCPGGSADA